MNEKRYYRSNEAAEYLGVNEKTIRKWAAENSPTGVTWFADFI